MNASGHQRWLRAALLFGIAYFVFGITFAALAGMAASNQMRVTWRLAAWLVSATAFAVHIACEHFRMRNSPSKTALHASLAAALGAFALAVTANVHAQCAASTSHQGLLAFALVAWPAVTAVPAFVVALTAAAVLARMRRRS
jgi:hypothetical protein